MVQRHSRPIQNPKFLCPAAAGADVSTTLEAGAGQRKTLFDELGFEGDAVAAAQVARSQCIS